MCMQLAACRLRRGIAVVGHKLKRTGFRRGGCFLSFPIRSPFFAAASHLLLLFRLLR